MEQTAAAAVTVTTVPRVSAIHSIRGTPDGNILCTGSDGAVKYLMPDVKG